MRKNTASIFVPQLIEALNSQCCCDITKAPVLDVPHLTD
jgi:hypothetical protein